MTTDRLTPQRPQNVPDGLTGIGLVPHRGPQTRPRLRQPLPHRLASPASGRSPPLSTNEMPVRSSEQAACRLVDSPPRERPRAGASWPPFFGPPGGVLMSPHHGRIDEERLELVILAGGYPLPQPLPEGARFPAAEVLVDGIPVPERLGPVAPRRAGACLVKDGFDEHPVAEARGAPGGVFEVTQNRVDFGSDGIRKEETSRHDRSPKKIIGGEPIYISRIRQHGLVTLG